MKKILAPLLLACSFTAAFSQLNMQLAANLPYPDSELNDIWGYTAPDGTEYALVGLRAGVSIVSLADPANPVEVHRIPGDHSVWRDLKTWQHFAYVTTDQPGSKEGLLVIDLGGLPGSIEYQNITKVYPNSTDTLYTCHNLWIDEFGFVYLTGCNYDPSNVIFLDLNPDPYNPQFAGYGVSVQSHDGYARDNVFYSAEIYEGRFTAYDVTDKADPVIVGGAPTPFSFCHNVWPSDDGTILFTTDERPNAPTAAYDVSDLKDIRLLDEFRPQATAGTGVIPHNVHVKDDFLVISHYTDGCVVVDAHEPDNLIEVGNWDTSTGFTKGFHGAWGAYPFFPSGLIIASDIENGLFVLQPDYVRASYLTGKVTDAETGAAIPAAEVEILSGNANLETTDLAGRYRTGQAQAGSFPVEFRARGYFDQPGLAALASGETTVLDAAMVPLPPHSINGTVTEKGTGAPIDSAVVFFENADFAYTARTDTEGKFALPAVLQGAYAVYVGKWGHENFTLENQSFSADEELHFELGLAYADNFNTTLGWATTGDATNGLWVRGVPNPTFAGGGTEILNPVHDSPDDEGGRCYVTGNNPDPSIFKDQVDGGATILTSLPMALRSRYNRPVLNYDAWFYIIGSNNAPNDTMTFFISNGKTTVELTHLDAATRGQAWLPSAKFDIADYIEVTDEMRLVVQVTDRADTPNVVEGGLDNFSVTEGIADEQFVVADDLVKIRVYPNPFHAKLTIDYKVEKAFDKLTLLVVDVLGRLVEEMPLANAIGSVELLPGYAPGVYFIAFRVDDELGEAVRLVKAR